MFVAAHEWSPPRNAKNLAPGLRSTSTPSELTRASHEGRLQHLYEALLQGEPDDALRNTAHAFLQGELEAVQAQDCELPASPQDLLAWMRNSAQLARAQYLAYLEERKAGAPRRYFGNRAHALYFLRGVAPTKLVDGAWLYGLLRHRRNPRFSDLVRTYLEELGDGVADKNHVLLYRQLLVQHGLEPAGGLEDGAYRQGALQLALGWSAEGFLPEVIGFNLGYEQLPLHLLITAHELNELGIDPYYFTLHVTVDNDDSGHARRAVQAVHEALPKLGDSGDFWRRVRNGCQLSGVGTGTHEVIANFDIGAEVLRILSQKSVAGHGAHSDYCRVAGRSVNDWLSQPAHIPGFLAALQEAGWIKRGAPVGESRFWGLLQGERAEMFGVFSPYELQVLHDWLRGDASADGQAYTEAALASPRRASFRATARLAAQRQPRGVCLPNDDALLDPDLQQLKQRFASMPDPRDVAQLLVEAMSPSAHWTPAGLYATRLFQQTFA
ncbi:MAG: iron-containing redox enzyme family protein [Polaromonas sp.]|uniref:iron-containing redox enzyme family protein n=1 Tax=Polaromonas sp. TaxID=1869339 RepID=UPI002724A358|nr:iron-containing redox enzyme family protein [Polaromonas sp.]MDO9113612.1 iron-containing redox enzyme family protein [Polaromonas sp.]MDP1885226.1 iron-containing redox enzyme family protein [Polaromonas sp.]